MKKCTKCGELKHVSEFYKLKGGKYGVRSICKKCENIENKKYYENNKEYYKEYYKEYHKTNYIRQWCISTRNTHKRNGFIVNITIDELYDLVKDKPCCSICGEELEWHPTGKFTALSPTLDRKYNGNEINKDNIMIMCNMCNATKQNRTMKEFIQYCEKVIKKFTGSD